MNAGQDKVRIDKWLWAARFFKTRSLATDAVDGGRVHLNGERVKPARTLKVGDVVRVQAEHGEFTVTVLALAERRGSAEVARTLYEESAESIRKREALDFERSLAPQLDPSQVKGRPTKKFRRQIERFNSGG
ncbi:RNA-binding S4 domain-containing protein [Chitinilyticum litopenaei]|uniref:RNA-binding S4 domain-containing protein n=1 Tax=Chitinilyticum litopenaei TaxID=1121276 RepID=UPI0003FA8D23|nr:RNA-binding S4 domain-containing protein [Chitinilyticum litopenaei]